MRLDECQDVCSECYRGESPFSEPETQAMKKELDETKNELENSLTENRSLNEDAFMLKKN